MTSSGPAVELVELLEKLHIGNHDDKLSGSGNTTTAPPVPTSATPTTGNLAASGTPSQPPHQPFADFSVWASRQTPQGNRSPTTAASRQSPAGSHTPVGGATTGLQTAASGHPLSVSPPPRFSADSFHHTTTISNGPMTVVNRGPLPVLHTPPRGGSGSERGGAAGGNPGTRQRTPNMVGPPASASSAGEVGGWSGRSGSVASETTFDALDRNHPTTGTQQPILSFVAPPPSDGNQSFPWLVSNDSHRNGGGASGGDGGGGLAVTPPHTTTTPSARVSSRVGSASSPIGGVSASPVGHAGGGGGGLGATAPHRVVAPPGQSESPLGSSGNHNWQSSTPSCRSTSPAAITAMSSGARRLSPSAPLFTPPHRSPGSSSLHPQPTALDGLSPSPGDVLSLGSGNIHHYASGGGSLFASVVGHHHHHCQHHPQNGLGLPGSAPIQSASQTPASSAVSGSATPQSQPASGGGGGQYFDAAKDQLQCRALQRAMETLPFDSPEIQTMVTELAPRLAELMIDPYGNFLVQKILEWAPDDYRLALVTSLSPCLAHIATAAHGTFAVQKLIESLRNDLEAQIVASGLALHLPLLMNDVNGGHVLNKVLHCLPPERRHFLYFGISSHAMEVCNDKQGCCAVQRCIAAATKEQFLLVQEAVLDPMHLLFITCNPYGNYVVSRLLERGTALLNDEERQAQLMTIVQRLMSYQSTQLAGELRRLRANLNAGGVARQTAPVVPFPPSTDGVGSHPSPQEQHILVMLCENKFSSNVMENVMRLSVGTPAFDVLLATIVETDRRPLEILFAGCGNYIIQCALMNCPVVASPTVVVNQRRGGADGGGSAIEYEQDSSSSNRGGDAGRNSHSHCATTTTTTTTALLVALVEALLPAMTIISSQNFGKNVEGAVADALERLFLAGYHLREGLQLPHVIQALLAARNCTTALASGCLTDVGLRDAPQPHGGGRGASYGALAHVSLGSNNSRTPPRTTTAQFSFQATSAAASVSPSHPHLRGMGGSSSAVGPAAMPGFGDAPTPPRLRPQKRGAPQQQHNGN